MNLISFEFGIFLIAVLIFYYISPKKYQWVGLLLGSSVFYILSSTSYTAIYLVFSVTSVFFTACYIEDAKKTAKCKRFLVLTICANVLLLAALKYLNGILFIGFRLDLLPYIETDWLASLGISFYTLQLISYLCDVYWGMSQAQRNPLKLALYALYFPSISSGPISRYGQLESVLFKSRKFNYKNLAFGLQRILYGIFKKIVIADNIALLMQPIFADTEKYSGFYIWVAIFATVIQVYADFSGSMDLVLGISECFGIFLPENFKNPLFSHTIQEFWQRWHITLGTWLKDYIMFPLLRSKSSNRLSKWIKSTLGKRAAKIVPTVLAMFVLWLANGIWHGVYPKYMVTGMWYWFAVTAGQVLDPVFAKINRIFKINTECTSWRMFQCLRTIMITGVGIVFFSSDGISSALSVFKSAAIFKIPDVPTILSLWVDKEHFTLFLLGVCVFAAIEAYQVFAGSVREWLSRQNLMFRWCVFYAVILLVSTILMASQPTEFIYFQF